MFDGTYTWSKRGHDYFRDGEPIDVVDVLTEQDHRITVQEQILEREQAEIERLKDKWRVADDLADERGQKLEQQQAEIERLREAGRYVAMALAGAADDGDDDDEGWSRDEIKRLFDHVCERWLEQETT